MSVTSRLERVLACWSSVDYLNTVLKQNDTKQSIQGIKFNSYLSCLYTYKSCLYCGYTNELDNKVQY